MAPTGAETQDKSTGEVVSDLVELVRDYAKQETVDPLKAIGRFLLWGVVGAVLLSVGLIFGALALVRALQVETGTRLTGSWDFVPYLAALVVSAAVAGLSIRAITKPNRESEPS